MTLSIGIDVGGTNLRLGLFDGLNLVRETRYHADFSGICKSFSAADAWQTILHEIATAITEIQGNDRQAATIGIGFPGFIDPQTGIIAQSPNFPGLRDVNLAKDLSAYIGKAVVVENDANAAAYGEYCLLGKPATGLIYFGLGTGVGGGLISNGKPFIGFHGCAMEVGHLIVESNGRLCGCGNRGCLEQYASASGIAQSYSIKGISAHEIAELARSGDEMAQSAYRLAGESLATAIAHVVKVVDIPQVVIGGGVSQAWDLIKTAFDARLDKDLIPVLRGKIKIHISQTSDIAGMLGASLLVNAI
jgi:glucokinase